MNSTYRDEYLFKGYQDWACIVSVIMYLGFAALAWTVAWPLSIVFIGIAAAHVVLTYKYNAKLYHKAMEHRKKMMTQGYRCMGKVVDAGGKVIHEREEYYDNAEGKRDYRIIYLANYWVEVEYFDSADSKVKRYKSEKFGKKTKGLIGKSAEVYVYNGEIYVHIP